MRLAYRWSILIGFFLLASLFFRLSFWALIIVLATDYFISRKKNKEKEKKL